MAMLYGMNPVEYGRLPPLERRWFEASLDRALKMDRERQQNRMKAYIDGIGGAVGSRVARVLARMFRA